MPCCQRMSEELHHAVCPSCAGVCADIVIRRHENGDYVIPIHDGGDSGITIHFCPWCGTRLES